MLFEIILWIIGITAFTLPGAWYAKKYNRADALIAIYVAFVILSQIMAAKIASYNLGFMVAFAPAAVLVYSVTYLLTDFVNEKFGRKETQKMIFIAFLTQVAMLFFLWLATRMTPAPFWENQAAWESIISVVPRITIASWAAFLVSENFDAYVFSWFKKVTKGKHLWMRNAFSSIPALGIDTFIFITLAFYGTMPVGTLIVGQLATKWLVGLVNIPFMYAGKKIMD